MTDKRSWMNLKGGLLAAVLIALGPQLGSVAWYLLIPALLTLGAWGVNEPQLKRLHLFVSLGLLGACLYQAPDLSDDYHRYLWEGFVANQGYSPYEHSPQSLYEALDHPSEGLVNHDSYTAIYPPMAQYLFRITDWLGSWKLVIILILLGACVPVADRDKKILLIFSPLVLVEGIWNAHLDVLGIIPGFFLVKGLRENNPIKAGLALAFMVGIKIIPLIFFPYCFLYFKNRNRWRFTAMVGVPVLLSYVPYLNQLPALFDSFRSYANIWQFNNLIFESLSTFLDKDLVRRAMGVHLIIFLTVNLIKPGDIVRKLATAWMLLIICSPTFFPWYLIWLVPLVPLERRHWLNMAYCATALSYLVLIPYRATGDWQVSWWWLILEWVILIFAFVMMLSKEKDRQKSELTY